MSLEEGAEYLVSEDDIDHYTASCYKSGTNYLIGNENLMTSSATDSGDHFLFIVKSDGSCSYYTTQNYALGYVSFNKKIIYSQTIDDYYIPYTIPRVNDDEVSENDTWSSSKISNSILTQQEIINLIYPVGAVYISASSTSPAALFGGTWTQVTGRYLLASTASGNSGNTSKSYTTASDHKHLAPVGYNSSNKLFGISYYHGSSSGNVNGGIATTGQAVSTGSGNYNWTLPSTGPAGAKTITIAPADILSIAPAYQVYVWRRTA